MKKLLAVLVVLSCMTGYLRAQTGGPANIAGTLYASNFANWSVGIGNNGPYSWSNPATCSSATAGGVTFRPFVVGSPIRIADSSTPGNSETVTVTAVNTTGSGCTITTTTPAHQHFSFFLTSATAGLQEAINYSIQQNAAYLIYATPDFTKMGGTTGTITSALGNTQTSILDARTSIIVPYVWTGSAYVAQPFGIGAAFPNTVAPVTSLSPSTSRAAILADYVGSASTLWNGAGCDTPTNVPAVNGTCVPPGTGAVTPAPQHQKTYYPNAGTVGQVAGDTAATTDGAGNETLVSIAPNSNAAGSAINLNVATLTQTINYQSPGVNQGYMLPSRLNVYQDAPFPGGCTFCSPIANFTQYQVGGLNVNSNLAGQWQQDNMVFDLRGPGQVGGIHNATIDCHSQGDCIPTAVEMYATGGSRGTDEMFEALGRGFTGFRNSNWGGTVGTITTNAVGDQIQTLNCLTPSGYSCANAAVNVILADLTRVTSSTNMTGMTISADGQSMILNFPAGHGLGVSTFTHTTAAIDSRIYSGTCPTVTPTGSTFPAIGVNANTNDGYTTNKIGIGTPQFNANYVNAPGGALVGFCVSVVSTTGFSDNDPISIMDSQADVDYTHVIHVADATHMTVYAHFPHNTNAVISKGGPTGMGVGAVADIAAPGTLTNGDQNFQNAPSSVIYPIAYCPDTTHCAAFVNSDVAIEYKTRAFTSTTPVMPITVTATGVSGGVITGITQTRGNYQALNGGGGLPVLPPPIITTNCTGTQPVFKVVGGENVNVQDYVVTLVSGGTSCPSSPTITVQPYTNNLFYFAPVTLSYRVADPNNCATTYPFNCSVTDGYVLTQPWIASSVVAGDVIANTRWWQRYGVGAGFLGNAGDPLVAYSGRTGLTQFTLGFSDLLNHQGYYDWLDNTPSTRYIGAFPDWAPTQAHPEYGQLTPGSLFVRIGGVDNDVFYLPPHGSSARVGPPISTFADPNTPNIGGTGRIYLCNANPTGQLTTLDDPCTHNQFYPFFDSVVGFGANGQFGMLIDPQTAFYGVTGGFFASRDFFLGGQFSATGLANSGKPDGSVRWLKQSPHSTFAMFCATCGASGEDYGIGGIDDGSLPATFNGLIPWYNGVGLRIATTDTSSAAIFGINTLNQTGGVHGLGQNMLWLNGNKAFGTFNSILDTGNGGMQVGGSLQVIGLAGTGTRCLHADGSGNVTPTTGDCSTGGPGSVTSVGLSLPGIFSVSGTPVTSSGTLTATLATQSANLVWAGPTTGAAAAPTFRSLVGADLPLFSSTLPGGVSASGGGTSNFLRADGSWAAPSGTGNTTSSLTSGFLPKANGTNSIINSLCDEGITTANTFTCTDTAGAAFQGQIVVASSSGIGGGEANVEGTAPTGVASSDIFWADSTAHRYKVINNNGTAAQFVISGADINTSDQVTVTHLALALPTNQGGTATTSTLTGLVRGGNPFTAAELSGDATTSGSNAVTVIRVNGLAVPASACDVSTNSSSQFTANTCTGSGATVLATSATLITPTLGVAAATSINKVTITTPASSATLTLANGSTFTLNGAFNTQFTGSANATFVLPGASDTLAGLGTAQTFGSKNIFPGGDLFNGGVNAQSGTSYAFVTSDENKLVTFNNASATAVTLSQATTTGFIVGAVFNVFNRGAGTVTITPSTSTINGATTLVLAQGQGAIIVSDGTNYSAQVSALGGATSFAGLTGNLGTTQGPTGITGIVRDNGSGTLSASELSGDATTSGSNAVTVVKINGTAFSGTNGHLVSFGASNTPADSGVVAANAVVAVSPGVGLCHFAGATQTCTSSTVATADIAANAVNSAKMAVVNTYRTCDIPVGDTSASALTNAQLGPQSRVCFIPAAATIVEMDVNADAGTPNIIVGRNRAGTIVNIVTGALATAASGGIACSNTGGTTGINGATTCSSTLQNTSLNAGDYLELVSGTAGGTAKFFVAHVIYTVN